ncbi:MAG: hypothetical protein MK213_00895, partial [Planctomycetes bacterium]|nr:hypothetical protein [Planctomycetota bacterium]
HEFTNPTTARAKDPHCEPLLALIELGWLGSLLLLGALWRVLRHPQRAAWTMYPLLVLGIHALVRSPFSDNGSSLALAGLLLGAQTFKTQADQETAPRRSWLPFLLVAPTLITASHQIAGEWHVSRALSQGERNGKEFTAAQTPLEKAVHWRPWDAVAWDMLAAQRSQEGRPVDEILHALQQAVRFDPSDLFALTHLFQIGAATGDLKLQLGAMERAELVAPGHPAVLENRTLWLEANADELKRQAREALLQGPSQVDVRPTFLLAHTLQALCHLRRSEQEQAFASLKQAAIYADQQRPLIQRMARQETLSETEIHALFRRIAPESMSRFLPAERDSAQ